jgi:hypothetical protein
MVLTRTVQNRDGGAPYAPPTLTAAGTFARRTKGIFGFFREGWIGQYW